MFGSATHRSGKRLYAVVRHATGGLLRRWLRNVAKPIGPKAKPDGDRRLASARRRLLQNRGTSRSDARHCSLLAIYRVARRGT